MISRARGDVTVTAGAGWLVRHRLAAGGALGVVAAAAAMATGTAAPANADIDVIVDPIIAPIMASVTESISAVDPGLAESLASATDTFLSGLNTDFGATDVAAGAVSSSADSAAAIDPASAVDPVAGDAAAVDPAGASDPAEQYAGEIWGPVHAWEQNWIDSAQGQAYGHPAQQ